MGVENVVYNHLPHPDRYFERRLFKMLETRGYDYRSLNEIGKGTLHYHFESIATNTNLRDWVPEWCFKFIFWAARRVGGTVSARLDWFAGRRVSLAPGSTPQTIDNLKDDADQPLSDHDPISLDVIVS